MRACRPARNSRKSSPAMWAGEVWQMRSMKISQIGQTNLRSCTPHFPRRNTPPPAPPPSTPTTPAPRLSRQSMRLSAAWASRPATSWSLPWASGTFLGFSRRRCKEAACTVWSWTASPAESPSSSIPRQTLPWQALKPPTDGISSTLPSATCPLDSTRSTTGLTTSSVFPFTTTFLPRRSTKFDPAA